MRFATITESLGVNLISAVLTLLAFLPVLVKLSSNITDAIITRKNFQIADGRIPDEQSRAGC